MIFLGDLMLKMYNKLYEINGKWVEIDDVAHKIIPTQKFEYNDTLAAMWIQEKLNQPIPEQLLHDPIYKIHDDNRTLCMHWIQYRPGEKIPKEIIHDPTIKDENGKTAFMYWIQYRPEEQIPPEIMHNLNIRDNLNCNYLDYYQEYKTLNN